jgi:hypothetical protein
LYTISRKGRRCIINNDDYLYDLFYRKPWHRPEEKYPLGSFVILHELWFCRRDFYCYAHIIYPTLDSGGKLYYSHQVCRIAKVIFPQLLRVSRIKVIEVDVYADSFSSYPHRCYYSFYDCHLFTPVPAKLSPVDKIRLRIAQEPMAPLVRDHEQLMIEHRKITLQRNNINSLLKQIVASEAHIS